MAPIVRAAVCHITPVYLDAAASTNKVVDWIRTAAGHGAHLVVFPESCIPAFPYWSTLISPAENHDFFIRMARQSLLADGSEISAIREAAKTNKVFVSVGFSEKAPYSSATLWNANMIISPEGEVLVHHRKLMPTQYEKLTWAPGDGHGLRVVDMPITPPEGESTGIAKLGMLICGENTNPLARYSMMAQGEQLHITTWPAKEPHRLRRDADEHADEGKTIRGSYDNLAVNRMRCGEHCFEAKSFGILCASVMSPQIVDSIVAGAAEDAQPAVRKTLETASQAESCFVGPSGLPVPGFTFDSSGNRQLCDRLQLEEGIIYADLDMEDTIEGKQYHDVVGSYQRLDVFSLSVDRTRKAPCTFRD